MSHLHFWERSNLRIILFVKNPWFSLHFSLHKDFPVVDHSSKAQWTSSSAHCSKLSQLLRAALDVPSNHHQHSNNPLTHPPRSPWTQQRGYSREIMIIRTNHAASLCFYYSNISVHFLIDEVLIEKKKPQWLHSHWLWSNIQTEFDLF